MSYQSLSFILFCIASLFLYYIAGKKLQKYVLAFINLAFYLFAGVKYLPFLLITAASTYLSGIFIGKIYDKADIKLLGCNTPQEKKDVRSEAKKKAKRFLLVALFVSVLLLAVCKYSGFAVKNLNRVLTYLNFAKVDTFKMILPLGISFYTFMAIGYVLDIYWKRYKAEKNFLYYALFLSYFPHIVQGPIDRYNEFKEQIADGIKLDYKNITFGAQLVIWGFFKKIVIADRLGLFVNEVVNNWKNYDGVLLISAFLVYSVQIYADFSGCIDIVTGISEMFGIKLRKNFNHPYFSRTMAEFWRRWHISLQEWFKDYIYFPVSSSRFVKNNKKKLKNKGRKRASELFASCFPILVVWIVTGVWHGASWKFILWGMYHAALLIGSEVFEPLFKKTNSLLHIDTENFGFHFLQMVRTYLLCSVGRIFFRADGVRYALSISKKIVTNTHFSALFACTLDKLSLDANDVLIMVVSVCILLIADILQEKMSLRETLSKQNIIFRWTVILGGLFAVIIFGMYGSGYDASSFIYEQF